MGGGIAALIAALASGSGRGQQQGAPTDAPLGLARMRSLGGEKAGFIGAPTPVPAAPRPPVQPYAAPPPIRIGPPDTEGPFRDMTPPLAAAIPPLSSVFPDMRPGETLAAYLARKGLAGGP